MMKKLLLFLMIAIVSTSYVNAQSFTLSNDDGPLPDTITLYQHPDTNQLIVFHAAVTNITHGILNVKVLRTNLDTVAGTVNSFCFANQCEMPTTDTSGLYLALPAGTTTDEASSLKGDYYYPVGTVGTSTVKYTIFNKEDFTDHVDVVVKYSTSPTAIDENIARSISLSNVYPNPTYNTINIDYNFDVNIDGASVKIVNLLGSIVKEVEMDQNANKLSMDVSDLTAGIYFYSIVVNNEIFKTKKLVKR